MKNKLSALLFAFMVISPSVLAQQVELDSRCTVSILNRNVQVNAAGRWRLANLPANVGRVRARANCQIDGETKAGHTQFFSVAPSQTVAVGDFKFADPDPVPRRLNFTDSVGTVVINSADTPYQLLVTATYSDGSESQVLDVLSGLNFSSSNPSIASVDPFGEITAFASGSVLITARLEGALAIKPVTVSLGGDSDGDGLSDDFELANGLDPNDPIDALEDLDSDGLTALGEFNAGTELRIADTDGDGLADGEEVVAGDDGFITDPLLLDTDGDLLSDGLEVQVGSDPLDVTSTNIADALDSIEVIPDVIDLVFNGIDTEASAPFQAIGHLIDGSQIDITSQQLGTVYSSSDNNIFNFSGEDGLVFAVQDGTATLTVSNGSVEATAQVNVSSFTPERLSSLTIPGFAHNVDVSGDLAYVASGTEGLTIVDVSDRTNPSIVSTLALAGDAIDVKVLGSTVYVAAREAGVHIISVSDPAAPQILSTAVTNGEARDLYVDGADLYVADGSGGFSLFNVGDPLQPYFLSGLEGLDNVIAVDVSGDLAVVMAGRTLRLIDVSNKAVPELLGGVTLSGGNEVVTDGRYAYVSRFGVGYSVVDITDTSAPEIISGNILFFPKDAVLRDGLAFFADSLFPNAVAFVNVSEPTAAVFQGIIDLSNDNLNHRFGLGISIDGSYVYNTRSTERDADSGGTSALYIAQYRRTEDNQGNPPDVSLSSPTASSAVVESQFYDIQVEASDDIAVDRVSILVNGETVAVLTQTPYRTRLLAPASGQPLSIVAEATDFGGNTAITDVLDVVIQLDADSDGLGDEQEAGLGTINTNPDTDGDGVIDGREVAIGTDPLDADTDDDGQADGSEVAADTDPLNPDIEPPVVTAVAPFDGETNVLESTLISLDINEPVRRRSFDNQSLRLVETQSGLDVAGESLISLDGRSIQFIPNQLLGDFTEYEIRLSGIRDLAGNPLAADFVSTFTTGNFVDTTRPTITSYSPENGDTDVPTNAFVSLQFSETIDRLTVTDTNIHIRDTLTDEIVGASLELSTDRTNVMVIPDQTLAVGRVHRIEVGGVLDLFGNQISPFEPSFTTSFDADDQAPVVVAFSMPEAYDQFPTNGQVDIRFSEPVSPLHLTGVVLLDGEGEVVPLTARNLIDGNRALSLMFASALMPNTSYTLQIAGIEDRAGNPMLSTVTRSFQTSAGEDQSRPIVDGSHISPTGSSVDVNAPIQVFFGEPINGVTHPINTMSFRDETDSRNIGVSTSLSSDHLILDIIPNENLQPGHRYRMNFPSSTSVKDLGGNRVAGSNVFTTSVSSESLALVTEAFADSTDNVPVNGRARLRFNEPLGTLLCPLEDNISLSAGAVAVPVNIELSSDGTVVTISAVGNLQVSTSYELSVGGLCDQSGNQIAPFTRTFTTSADATEDVTRPTLVSTTPANSATNVSVDTAVSIEFSEPIDAMTTVEANMYLYVGSSESDRVAATITSDVTGKIWTLTPVSPLPANTQVTFRVVTVRDFAGNLFIGTTRRFTTESGNEDITAPVVEIISPMDGAVDVATASPVVLTFSESLDASTITNTNFALFAGGEKLTTTVSRSFDNRTVTLSASLPEESLISVVADNDVTDISGNALQDYISLFTTETAQDLERPSIVRVYPGNGASDVSTDRAFILYASERLNTGTVNENTIRVSQGGVLIDGQVSISGDDQIIRFEPTQPWQPDSYVQVFVDSDVEDLDGNAMTGFSSYFRVMVDTSDETPRVLMTSVVRGGLPLNPVFKMLFSAPLDPMIVDSNSVQLFGGSSTNNATPSSVSLSADGLLLEIRPDGDLEDPSNSHLYEARLDVQGLNGDPVNLVQQYWILDAGAVRDDVSPVLLSTSPPDGLSDVGVNTRIRLKYDSRVEPLSLRDRSINGLAAHSISFSADNTEVIYTPHEPLPSSQMIVFGIPAVEDYAGNENAPSDLTITTADGPDLQTPSLVETLPAGNAIDVPVNSIIKLEFDEVLDPVSVNLSNITLKDRNLNQNLPITLTLDSSGSTVEVRPDSNLIIGTEYEITVNRNVTDLYGNRLPFQQLFRFTAAFDADTQEPEVEAFSMPADYEQFPINGDIWVRINEPINPFKLDGIELIRAGSVVLLASKRLSDGDRIVVLETGTLLDANTDYLIRISGVEDRSGNLLPAVIERSFTTTSGIDLDQPREVRFSPIGSSVDLDAPIVLEYAEPLNGVDYQLGSFTFRDNTVGRNIGLSYALSEDHLRLGIVPDEALEAGKEYRLTSSSSVSPRDLGGNRITGVSRSFATGTAPAEPLTLVSESFADGTTEVPVNGRIRLQFNEALGVLICPIEDSVVLSAGGAPVATDVLLENSQSLITITVVGGLQPSTSYELSVNGLCDQSGNQVTPFTRNFTTSADAEDDVTRPAFVTSNPIDGATGISVDTAFSIEFSETVDALTVVDANVYLYVGLFASNRVAVTITADATGKIWTLTPESPLPANSDITLQINSVRDLAGNQSFSTIRRFTTE